MMKFIFFVVLTTAAHAWNISREQLAEKIAKPIPTWMQERIEKDLQDVRSGSLRETLHAIQRIQGGELAQLVRIQFVQGRGSWESLSVSAQDPQRVRATYFIEALELLHSIAPLPNFELLLSLSDRFDRPTLLRELKVPVFATSKHDANSQVILIPDGFWTPEREAVFKQVSIEYPWFQKQDKAFWRGSATGGFYIYWEWDFKPRSQLVLLSKRKPELVDALFVHNEIFRKLPWHINEWFSKYQLVGPFVPPVEHLAYKYLVAIDGDAIADSLQWQLFSGCTILKNNSPQVQWFYDELKPYVHYVPYNSNQVDFEQQVHWLLNNDQQAQEIAENAACFAHDHLLDEELFLYLHKLLSAYAQHE